MKRPDLARFGPHKFGKNRINIRKIQGLSWDRLEAVGSGVGRFRALIIAKKGNFAEKWEKYRKNVSDLATIKSM